MFTGAKLSGAAAIGAGAASGAAAFAIVTCGRGRGNGTFFCAASAAVPQAVSARIVATWRARFELAVVNSGPFRPTRAARYLFR